MQFGINQRILSFTNVSPNMMMLGDQMDEITDVQVFKHGFNKLFKWKNDQKQSKWSETELEFIKKLKLQLQIMHNTFNKDFNKYVLIMKDNYDIDKYSDNLRINDQVVYYIGDRDATMRKLRNKWSGPWRLSDRLYDNCVILMDDKKGQKFEAHVSRVKKYHSRAFWKLSKYNKLIENNEIVDELQLDENH